MKRKYTTYRDLLEYAERECDAFSLVWRGEFAFHRSAWDLTAALASHLISESSARKWPGTEIFGGKARLRTYAVNDETLSILGRVSSVFGWVAPDYPEDLAFYRNGKVVFASVAHEGDAWFEAW